MAPAKAEYVVEGNVLKVKGRLDFSEEQRLRRQSEILASVPSAEAVLDLSQVSYIASSCLGIILLVHEDLGRHGIKLKVRLARPLLYIYDLMGVRNVVKTEVVD